MLEMPAREFCAEILREEPKSFAYYEGHGGSECCGSTLAAAAPLAVGKELVERHGFFWIMVRAEGGWHFAVTHPSTGLFIDLENLDNGEWLKDEFPKRRAPGEWAHDSLPFILKALENKISQDKHNT